jgi:PAS domain S-box-containing protein
VKQALAKQKRPLIMGVLVTLVVSAFIYWADNNEAERQQSRAATEQIRLLATGMTAAQGELLATSVFMEQSNAALDRFEAFINRLMVSSPQKTDWAVIARVEAKDLAQFQGWARTVSSLTNTAFTPQNQDQAQNYILTAAGSAQQLLPGRSVVLPASALSTRGPALLLDQQLLGSKQGDALWMVQKATTSPVRQANGVAALYVLRRVDLERQRLLANLSPRQHFQITWRDADKPETLNTIGNPNLNSGNTATTALNIGSSNLSLIIDKPPIASLPRTWLLLLLAGLASTAFWVSWRAAGTLNDRAGALAEAVSQTSGHLRAVNEKENVFFENTGTPHCEVDPRDGKFLRANRALCEWLGYSAEELLQKTAYDVSAAEDVEVSRAHVRHINTVPNTLLQFEKRYITKSGSTLWGLVTSNLFENSVTGSKVFLTTIVDITLRKEADAMRDRLLRELAHRVRNTMQLTDSLARQSAVGALSVQDYAREFRNRLGALSQAQDLLFDTNWVSANMREIARRVIMPFDNGKITIDLPDLSLPPQHAQTFALAVHELISQSAAWGAVKAGNPVMFKGVLGGLDDAGRRDFTLSWTESFRNTDRKETDRNFRQTMLKLALPTQFEGEAEATHTTSGFTYLAKLKAPLAY